jgi:hypothetical protein
MNNLSSRHQLVCAIVHGYPDAAEALAGALGMPLPEHDQVVPAPDSHYLKDGRTVYTDAAVRLLRAGKPVFFVTVEMQREHARGKYATLHAYHGSGVEKINAGGHLFVLSDKPGTAEQFRKEDADRRAELAFVASFHSGGDLGPMREAEGLSLGARAVPAALTDFSAGVPDWAQDMLIELISGDLTLANLYFRTMMEEAPKMTMLEAALTPEMLERLRELESFRDYEARVRAEAEAEANTEAEAKVAKAEAKVAKAEAKIAKAEAKIAKAEARVKAADLRDFLIIRGDKPSKHAFEIISDCQDAGKLDGWLKRAYLGETSAQLFPEPEDPAPPAV